MRFMSKFLAVIIGFAAIPAVMLYAQDSGNYNLEEFYIGPGGTLDSNSASFNLRGTLGEIGQGESASANYNLLAGFTTDDEPSLGVDVANVSVDFGLLDEFTTGTGNATFSVLSYNTSGYVVQTVSAPPTNGAGGNELAPMTTQSTSSQGTEQFGINLTANTSPVVFGANPVQQPNASFSYGFVDDDYNDPNLFKYVRGDVIARSTSSTGYTLYTISYIANVSSLTAGGTYTTSHDLVVTGTY